VFERQAKATPHAVALAIADRRVSYAELKCMSDRIACALKARGVARGEAVGLAIERCPEQIAAILGILKAGAAYVPFDLLDPTDRLRFLLSEAGIRLVVTGGTVPAVPIGCRTIGVDEALAHEGNHAALAGDTDDLAYIMFTSGSTGSPKGVEIPHRGVLRLVSGDYIRFGADRVFLHLSPPNFDASTLEIWGPLLHGGICALYPERLPTVSGLERAIAAHGVTTLWLTAALFNTVIDDDPRIMAPVGEVLAGGEALSVAHVRRAIDALPGTQFINGYGPTESTTFTCCYRIPRDFGTPGEAGIPCRTLEARSVPIGTPIAETGVAILNEALEPVPLCAVGELCISGAGLALGYRNRPELTAQKFIIHPVNGVRYYRSGDQVRRREDGLIEFVGRLDHQVKIRGHRIEPGEIEAELLRLPGVTEAAVVVQRLGKHNRQQLVGFFAPRRGAVVDPAELRDRLKARLPEYMIPNPLVALMELPKNSNGKVDRATLNSAPLPEHHADANERPRAGSVEARIAGRMSEILGVSDIGSNENFFDLGGDSLSAVQLIAWMEEEFGKKIDVLHDLTPAALAWELSSQPAGVDGIVLMKDGPESSPPAFFVHGIDGRVPLYASLFRKMRSGPIFGLTLTDATATDSIESIAAHHVANLRKFTPGPYRLCGLSFGGLVAFEMAQQLLLAGESVVSLVLLDTSVFGLRVDWTLSEQAAQWTRRFRTRVDILKKGDASKTLTYLGERSVAIWRLLRNRLPLSRQILDEQVKQVASAESLPLSISLLRTMVDYSPKPYSGDMVLLRASEYYSGDTAFDPQNGWGKFVRGKLAVYQVPGNHLTMLHGDNVGEMARLLHKALLA
jgi:amino acid adenylation domain-containing protein